MRIYLEVTRDKYEFPIKIVDSIGELAKMCGVSVNNIQSQLSKYRRLGKSTRYRMVEVRE